MATITASPPAMSPPLPATNTTLPSLPPLITTTATPRRTSSQRPTSYAERRMSSFSTASRGSQPQQQSRPVSHVFPAFHSSLPYTLVRDFAYLTTHPLHYGPPPIPSGMSTPASEARRLSDPTVSTWEDGRGQWSATPPWISETTQTLTQRDRLPAMTFNDGGPPYSEDEDIQSPVVTTSRHKKNKSNERGRSPGAAGPNRGVLVGAGGQQDELDGPGEAVDTYESNNTLRFPRQPQHRDSNFAKPLQRNQSPVITTEEPVSEDDFSEADDDARFSKDYSFTIASPDEEMHGKAVALFDFESEHQNELPLKEGQIILVSYRQTQGWLVAEDPRTGESGLVPEEFVRLVRDIEGGLHGLNSVTLDPEDNADGIISPVSGDPSAMNTPVQNNHEFSHHAFKPSNGSNISEKHPPVQSNFSTSSRDFSPYPLPGKGGDDATTPTAAGQKDNTSS